MQVDNFKTSKKYIVDSIYNLNNAITQKLEICYIGYENTEEGFQELWIKKKDWNSYIKILMESAISIEEYGLCAELEKMKNLL